MSELANLPSSYFNINSDADLIQSLTSTELIKKTINDKIGTYQRMDVKETMLHLKFTSELLRIAFAGSYGFASNKPIALILSKYQTLIAETSKESGNFLRNSYKAIVLHKKALEVYSKNVQFAIKLLAGTSQMAAAMSLACNSLIELSTELCKAAEDAFTQASSDLTLTDQEKKNIEKIKNEVAAEKSAFEKNVSTFSRLADEKKKLAQGARDQAKKQADAEFGAMLAKEIIGGLMQITQIFKPNQSPTPQSSNPRSAQTANPQAAPSNAQPNNVNQVEISKLKTELEENQKLLNQIIEKQKNGVLNENEISKKSDLEQRVKDIPNKIEQLSKVIPASTGGNTTSQKPTSYIDLELEYHREQMRMEEQLADNVSKLAASTTKLAGLTTQENNLSDSVEALGLAMSSMAIVKTILTKIKVFWDQVKAQCDELSDISKLVMSSEFDSDFFKEAIIENGLNWVAFGKINYDASYYIAQVLNSANNAMCSIPKDKAEAKQIVQEGKSRITVISSQMLKNDDFKAIKN
ncbi:hypothetical protein ACTFIZ_011823 [Dictyostelium cf. discoideum]